MDELRYKIVVNMNYTVAQLNAADASEKYKIEKFHELGFDTKFIMKKVVELYINFSKYESFISTVVQDERSYDEEIFDRTY